MIMLFFHRNPDIIDCGERFLKFLGYNGYSCMEFKQDARDGVYKLMEINGRFNLSILHASKCGINFPYMSYLHQAYGQLPKPTPFETGIYWIDEIKDLFTSLAFFSREHYGMGKLMEPYLHPKVFATFDRKDPIPFLMRLFKLLIEVPLNKIKEGLMGTMHYCPKAQK